MSNHHLQKQPEPETETLSLSELLQEQETAQKPQKDHVERRNLLVGAAVAATAVAATASAQLLLGRPSRGRGLIQTNVRRNTGPRPAGLPQAVALTRHVPDSNVNADTTLRLLHRATYAPTANEIQNITQLGYLGWLDRQLDHQNIPLDNVQPWLGDQCPELTMSRRQILDHTDGWAGVTSWNRYLYILAAHSDRQLFTRMLEFWTDHFYVSREKITNPTTAYYFHTIRPHALGSFRTLLHAVSNDAAMMHFLDNDQNHAGRHNVNFARELLELHTVGVNGGYTEADIYELSRALSGWSRVWKPGDPTHWIFEFQSRFNDPTPVTVMGQRFAQTGKAKGDAILDWLVTHPSTVRFIGEKLCRWFLGHNGTEAQHAAIAQAWGADGNIPAVLRVILAPQNIDTARPKFKRPFHLFAGALRQLEVRYDPDRFRQFTRSSNHEALAWEQPDGFPDSFDHWGGGMPTRLRFVLSLSRGTNHFNYDLTPLLNLSPNELVNALDQLVHLGKMPVGERLWIRRYAGARPRNARRASTSLALALGSPSYQWF